jgi:hypothetical protein
MKILIPWIAVFLVCLAASFVGAYLQSKKRKQRALLKKLGVTESYSALEATNPDPDFSQAGTRINRQAKTHSYTN